MIYVFGRDMQWAENFAWEQQFRGARCYSPASRSVYGPRYYLDDKIYILPGTPAQLVDVVRRDLVKTPQDQRPELRFVDE